MALTEKPLKHLNQIAERPKLNIEFEDLKYSVRDRNVNGGWVQILHSVHGKFRSGELTAIVGPSGAGKSTLLNILAGYTKFGVQGNIKVNDISRDNVAIHEMSSYIMQDIIIQPYLTLKEAVMYAAAFKLGPYIKYKEKVAVVEEIIDFLNLTKCVDTYSEHLSGGEQKRLTIALELVNNPSIIFLDEPITGLDYFAVKHCVDLLKKISMLDRTVVCTIHQLSASLFQSFDQIYMLADGFCVYNGSPTQMVSFITTVGYSCPLNSTPADYMIELVHSQSSIINSFKNAIENGKINMRETVENDQNLDSIDQEVCDDISQYMSQKIETDFSNSFHIQFFLLLFRMLLQKKRNRTSLYIQICHHIFLGMVIGLIFIGIGNDASQVVTVAKFNICCICFFTYTYAFIPILLLPLEIQLVKREYFNRWYGLKAYYSALTVVSLPLTVMIILVIIFSTIVYFITDQPREISRFVGFCLISFSIALTSQSLGYLIGSIFSVTNGSIVGPVIIAVHLILAVYISGSKTTEPLYQFLTTITYSRFGMIGYCNILWYKRTPLICPNDEDYCHYIEPGNFMRDVAVPPTDYKSQLGCVFIFMMIFQIMGYLSLKCRLNVELFSKIMYYLNKNVRYKR